MTFILLMNNLSELRQCNKTAKDYLQENINVMKEHEQVKPDKMIILEQLKDNVTAKGKISLGFSKKFAEWFASKKSLDDLRGLEEIAMKLDQKKIEKAGKN